MNQIPLVTKDGSLNVQSHRLLNQSREEIYNEVSLGRFKCI